MTTKEAIKTAQSLNLDLVEIQPNAIPPVVKIMNYGKFKFNVNKKKLLEKKKNKDIKIKETKFRLNTAINDYETKIKNISNFLKNGNKAKITIIFKGREVMYKENGLEIIKKIKKDLEFFGKDETQPKFEGKSITMILKPNKSNGKSNDKNK